MNKTSLITSAAGIALLLASAAPALAEDSNAGASVDASVTAGTRVEDRGDRGPGGLLEKLHLNLNGSTTVRAKLDAREQEREQEHASTTQAHIEKAQEKGDMSIDKRIESLQELSARLASIKLLPADTLASIQATITQEISQLTALKAQIGSDTATTTLKADLKSLTTGNRVFLLVEPKARIAASASRITAVVTQLTTLSSKLQARITAAQTAGTDVSAATTALTDLNAKLADAKAQADAAVSATANLQVDNGDKTVLAANNAALKDARTKLANAEKDLAAARHDAATIYGVVKGSGGAEVHATTTENR